MSDATEPVFRLIGAKVAVFGYGADARAQALALHQSGNTVTLAVPPGASADRALADGFGVAPAPRAVDGASVIIVALQDEQPATFWSACAAQVAPAALVVYRSGLAVETGMFDPPGTDVVVIANHGDAVRIAVHRDGTGRALVRAIAYARAAFGESITVDGSTVAAEVDLELAAVGERVGGVFALLGQSPARPAEEPEATTTEVVLLRSLR
jgi:ketol-acid reductoisomerase